MALYCGPLGLFVLLFRANRLLVSAKARVGTSTVLCCSFALAERIPAGALGAAVVRRFSRLAAVAPVGRRAYGRSGRKSGTSYCHREAVIDLDHVDHGQVEILPDHLGGDIGRKFLDRRSPSAPDARHSLRPPG
jgi:hypothetical protein